MGERVRITDVSPRDGLQNEPGVIPTADKVRLVELLALTGVDEIEVTSFVSPKWVPQLGDAADVVRELYNREGLAEYLGSGLTETAPMLSALIPNEKGMQSLIDVSELIGRFLIEKVSVFTAASETFNKKNTNASISESIERFKPVIERACSFRMQLRGYLSCVIACPFEGPIDPKVVAMWAFVLYDMGGISEIDLGDTIGAGTPQSVERMLRAVQETLKAEDADPVLTLHLHDTFGRAAECVKVALDMGIRSFDGSVAGLGGCPYASTPGKRAPGNISTETLVRTIHDAGYETGVDMDKLNEAAEFARGIVAKARAGA